MRDQRNNLKIPLYLLIGLLAFLALSSTAPFAHGAEDDRHRQQSDSTPDAGATKVSALQTEAAAILATRTAEALLSATPTPTRTPTPTPQAALSIAQVLLGELTIRSGPGMNHSQIGTATIGQQFPIVGKTADCSWLQIQLEDGSVGWITGLAAYVKRLIPCGAIPTIRVSAAPAAASIPTDTPASAAATPRPPTATPRPPQAQAPAAPAAQAPAASAPPGMMTSFEPLGNWRRGDEPYGTLTQSTAQVAHGNASAQLSYDFPATAGGKSYVVFLSQPALPISRDAQSLQMQVFGDGSGHILNAWVRDASGQVWQTTFGFVRHAGWAPMSATLAASREWPNGPISASSDQLTPPLSLYALVLDGVPDGTASSGAIYLDALSAVGSGGAGSVSAPAAAGGAAPSAPAAGGAAPSAPAAEAPAAAPAAPAAVPSGPLGGKIAFTRFNGRSMDTLVYDVAGARIISNLANVRQPDLAGGMLLVNGDGGGSESILRMSIGGDGRRTITMNTEDAFPQWSPSMESLVYASEKGGDRKSRLYFQADASDEQNVEPILYNRREIFGDYPVYLDNWRIAFQGCDSWAGGSRCGIYTGDTRGGTPTRLTDQTADIPSGNLGSEVIFSSPRAGNWDVWIVGPDGGNLRQLTTDPAIDGLGVASPDKTSIAFVSNRGGSWAVWVMNVDGSNQRKLFDIEGSYGGGEYDWIRERISWGQ